MSTTPGNQQKISLTVPMCLQPILHVCTLAQVPAGGPPKSAVRANLSHANVPADLCLLLFAVNTMYSMPVQQEGLPSIWSIYPGASQSQWSPNYPFANPVGTQFQYCTLCIHCALALSNSVALPLNVFWHASGL